MLVRLINLEEINNVINLCNFVRDDLNKNNINIWDDDYPSHDIFIEDIKNKRLWCIEENSEIIGLVTVIDNIYDELSWDGAENILSNIKNITNANEVCNAYSVSNTNEVCNVYFLSRLMINPNYQRKGYGTILLKNIIKQNKNKTCCLLVSKINLKAILFYKNIGFKYLLSCNVPWSNDLFELLFL